MWRPEGWKNPNDDKSLRVKETCLKGCGMFIYQACQMDPCEAFEAGADAMLEALRRNELKVNGSYFGNDDEHVLFIKSPSYPANTSKLVFIPGDK